MTKIKKAIFWDRDGVINKVIIRNDRLSSPWTMEEFVFESRAKGILQESKRLGFLNIIFTNQPDIKRGFMKKELMEKMNRRVLSTLAVDAIKFCPHDDSDNCLCRKPKPGMILEAANEWAIDLKSSYVIGDSHKDIEAGKSAGCKTILIRRNYNKDFKDSDFLINDIKEAVEIIKKHE